jgi:calcineurin-like phosphoesterase family protein
MDYFSSDWHFGHSNIMRYCKRKFKHIDHHDKALIRNCNDVVGENDRLIFVGDLSLKAANNKGYYQRLISKIKCKNKIIIPGNHDRNNFRFYAGDGGVGFKQLIWPYMEYEEFIVCHDPSLSQVDRNRFFICGHVHDHYHILGNVFNCGVDVNDFKPVSIESIRQQLIDERNKNVK